MQEAYWLGRQGGFELGGTSIHSYRETEIEDLDIERLDAAWSALVRRHDALRSVVTESGTQRMVRDTTPYKIALTDPRDCGPEAVSEHLEATRHEMSHRLFPLDVWPQWEIRATRIDDRLTRLHIGFDGMLIDDRSYQILIREWIRLYRDPSLSLPPLAYSFRDYVLEERARRESPAYIQALTYWRERVANLPESARLPMAKHFRAVQARFERYSAKLDKAEWEALKAHCRENRVTPAGLLLACFMEVLGRWSKSPELTVSVPTLNRPPFHEHINDVVGDFGSFVLIGNDGLASGTLAERIQGIQKRLWEGLEHDCVSGVRIIRELMQHRQSSGSAQVPVVFTMASSLRDGQAAAGARAEDAEVLYGITQTPQVYLDHQAAEMQGCLHFNWDVVEELFPSGLMHVLFEAYCGLLRSLAADASLLGQTSPVDIPPEQRRERVHANATDAPIPDGLLHDFGGPLDAALANAPAVISSQRILSHRELAGLSDALAQRLLSEGVRPNELVAVVAHKGWEQIVAVRATLAAGAAYLPVAADLPADYRQSLLERTNARIVLAPSALLQVQEFGGLSQIAIDEVVPLDAACDGSDAAPCEPDDLAYVIFTSGSTGQPKGVMITHRSAVNTVQDVNRRFQLTAGDRVIAVSSLSFDLSVYDIFGALAVGACVVLPEQGRQRDAAYLHRLMHENSVTVWNSVPALMEMLVQYAEDSGTRLPPSLRLVLLSGDWIPVDLPGRIRALSDEVEIVSLGGATEGAIWSVFFPIGSVSPSWPSIPYGRPLSNQRLHVLDAQDRDCPVWVPGRLCIEGTGLAVGYWDDRAQTDLRFRSRAGSRERLYDTGDWARYLPGGDIEFLGRDDRQVKLNGFRVELDEVESQLRKHPSVALAAVVKTQSNQLLAVVTSADPACSVETLRAHLAGRLPAYMIPSQIRVLDALPMTRNGKIDYGSLQGDIDEIASSVAPDDARSRQFLEDIAEILGLERVDTSKSLIALGGASLEIVRLSNRVRAYAQDRLRLEDYFAAQSIDALLLALADNPRASDVMPARQRAASGRLADWPSLGPAVKKAHVGLREDLREAAAVQLVRDPEADPSLRRRLRSYRCYSLRPIGFRTLSRWLAPLAALDSAEGPSYRYGSAGSLYPVQAYLHVKPGRVSGLLGGDYYYHPGQQRLSELNPRSRLPRDVYGDENRPIYDQAGLVVFLVCSLDEVEASYGEWGYDLAMYEAGSMGQLLREAAAPLGLGLCSIGTLDFSRVRPGFGIDERHVLLHSMACGVVDEGSSDIDWEHGVGHESIGELDRAVSLLRRVEALDEPQARDLDACIAGDG